VGVSGQQAARTALRAAFSGRVRSWVRAVVDVDVGVGVGATAGNGMLGERYGGQKSAVAMAEVVVETVVLEEMEAEREEADDEKA
jgi:hypothetical protein